MVGSTNARPHAVLDCHPFATRGTCVDGPTGEQVATRPLALRNELIIVRDGHDRSPARMSPTYRLFRSFIPPPPPPWLSVNTLLGSLVYVRGLLRAWMTPVECHLRTGSVPENRIFVLFNSIYHVFQPIAGPEIIDLRAQRVRAQLYLFATYTQPCAAFTPFRLDSRALLVCTLSCTVGQRHSSQLNRPLSFRHGRPG